MAGTKVGGQRAAATNKARHGADFYAKIGAKGGINGKSGGFASTEVGADGLTGKQRARVAGAIGGRNGKRGYIKRLKDETDEAYEIRKRVFAEVMKNRKAKEQ